MSATVETTTRRVSQRHAESPRHVTFDPSVAVAVVRLLAVAVMVTDRRAAREQSPPLPQPPGYRNWPSIEFDAESRGRRQRLIYYVSPKVLCASDLDASPVGTVFVVETRRIVGPDEVNVSDGKRRDTALRSVFVLSKYADVSRDSSNRCAEGAWAYATYGPRGELLRRDGSAYGVCRLPLQ